MALFKHISVVVRGGGDLGSGVIYRLCKVGFPVFVTELPAPLFVRRMVSYGNAVYEQKVTIEGMTAVYSNDLVDAIQHSQNGFISVLVDENDTLIQDLHPQVVIDARMAKVNLGTRITDAPLVIALGPGFRAGEDCHRVIETQRGHNLGRVICAGRAEADTGEPGKVQGISHSRVLRAPTEGHVMAAAQIGDSLAEGATIATVNGQAVLAPFAGVLRGLIHERVNVSQGMKIGDLDPRAQRERCFTISDKALAIGGGVLEAVFSAAQIQPYLGVQTS